MNRPASPKVLWPAASPCWPRQSGALVGINSDARLYAGRFEGEEAASLSLAPGRLAYVHLARGELTVNGERLRAGDALQIEPDAGQVASISLAGGVGAEVLVFELGRAG